MPCLKVVLSVDWFKWKGAVEESAIPDERILGYSARFSSDYNNSGFCNTCNDIIFDAHIGIRNYSLTDKF